LDELEEIFNAVSDPAHDQYRNFLSIEDITALIAPPVEDRKVVKKWLAANGVSKDSIVDHGDSLEVHATVEVASRLFYTEFKTFRNKAHGIVFFFASWTQHLTYLSRKETNPSIWRFLNSFSP
jgi:hypothetical protein